MNLQALTTFLAIIETGSLVRAAERLNVTQSTVTARLKALEDHLGQPLINRHKSGATPTAAGVRLRRYAQTITGLWSQARQETALPRATSSFCNIGCHPDLWSGLGEAMVADIRRTEPQAAMSVWLGSTDELAAWLRDGLADLVLTPSPPRHGRIEAHALPPDRLILVSTCPDAPIRFDPGYVFVEAGDTFGHDHAVAYADAGTARISFGSAQPALDHILTHGGSAYLPERMVQRLIGTRRLYALEAPAFERGVHLVLNPKAARTWRWLPSIREALAAKSYPADKG